MAGLKLMTTGGFVPRVAPHLLNDNEAQKALNAKLYSGSLKSWKKPAPIQPYVTVAPDTETIYKGLDSSSDDIWLAWNTDVNVVSSPLETAAPMMIYYTGDGVPKKTNSTLAGTANGENPDAWYQMGVPAPTTKPTVARTGTGASPETRIYVYTYINEFGTVEEESAPSPVSDEVLCGSGDTVTVSGFAAAPTSNLNITKRRIYRSVAGSGATTFQFVTEIPLATTSFVDNVASAGLGEQLQTLDWSTPPADLQGLVALPNAFLAGFSDESVYFSEVNAPHAWPFKYAISVGQKIVGLGVFGQSVVVMTKGYPFVISGVSPESMSAEKLPILEPCVSKQSITSDMSGVTYASPNGLVAVGPGQSGLITKNVMLRDDFQVYSPTTMKSVFYAGKYFGFFTNGYGDLEKGAFILDSNIQSTPLTTINLSTNAVFVDIDTANFYLVVDNRICLWEGDPYNTLPYEWISKEFVLTAPVNMGAMEVSATFGNIQDAEALQAEIARVSAENAVLFGSGANLKSSLNETLLGSEVLHNSILTYLPQIVDTRYLLIEVYCDKKLVHSHSYTKDGVYRMPAGYKGQKFEIKINGNIELRYIKMAETVSELKTL